MPLFFAIVTVVSLLLALLVLGAPLLLVILVIKAVLAKRHSRPGAVDVDGDPRWMTSGPPTNDELFTDLIRRQWPLEATGLQHRPSIDE